MTDYQRFASGRPDVMVYQTDVLTEDITITGSLTASLFVSTTGIDADYVVKLIDVFQPDKTAREGEEVRTPYHDTGTELVVPTGRQKPSEIR